MYSDEKIVSTCEKSLENNICYFCWKEKSNWEYDEKVNLYKIISSFNIIIYSSKKYLKTTIIVPKCSKCYKVEKYNESISLTFWFYFWLILSILFYFFQSYIFSLNWRESLTWWSVFFFCILVFLIFFVVIFFISYLILDIVRKSPDLWRIVNKNIKKYGPIAKYISNWWKIWEKPW